MLWNSGRKRAEAAEEWPRTPEIPSDGPDVSRIDPPGCYLTVWYPCHHFKAPRKSDHPGNAKIVARYKIKSLAKCNSSLIWLIHLILYWISTDFCRKICIYTGPVLKHTWSSVWELNNVYFAKECQVQSFHTLGELFSAELYFHFLPLLFVRHVCAC